jgi:GNAT superfamily N-acetyltransferase
MPDLHAASFKFATSLLRIKRTRLVEVDAMRCAVSVSSVALRRDGPMNTSSFSIRSLQPGEWALLKTLRITALDSDPQSYWETAADARTCDDVYWNTFARKLTSPNGSRMFILESASVDSGFVFGVRKDGDEYRVGGLWVDPAQRRKGFGSLLVQEVVAWARADSTTAVIQLWCSIGPAMAFYQRNGFHSLERFRTNDSDGRQIVEMEWQDNRDGESDRN